MCPQSTEISRVRQMMDPDLFEKIVSEIGENNPNIPVCYHISGEPLLHPRVVDFIKMTADKKLLPHLVTNATLLTRDMSAKLIEAGLKNIAFSFEGINKTVYESIRVGANYEKVLGNIEAFLELNKINKRVVTELVCVDLPNVPTNEITAFLDKMRGRFDTINRSGYFDWLGKVAKAQYEKRSYIGCSVLKSDLNVLCDGRVVPCCMDVDGKMVVGDFKTMAYKEIMCSPERLTLQAKLSSRQLNGLPCENCQTPWAGRSVRPS